MRDLSNATNSFSPTAYWGAWLFALPLVLLAGCRAPLQQDKADEGPQYPARIIWGTSIDGVEIGDSASAVIQKLGQPPGTAIPDYPGEIYLYTEEDSVFMEVFISDISPLGVIFIRVQTPYIGKTGEDVGIGTQRSDVLESYGQPNRSDDSYLPIIYDFYLFDDNEFIIEYHQDMISSIKMQNIPLN